ncbi:M24 family metallopeptidase [Cumulibacter soli]|uniref:M24 family metallopeptidase n=1 Tax=Cumulibacter soli TaxID=2546344 RepID=UPI00106862AE|nr:Xaa-Pro peptidase family protein [Cumulibacter soli]
MTSTAEFSRRLSRAAQLLRASGRSALIASPGADLRYLCGHDVHLTERITALVVRADGDPVLVTPTLERPGADGSGVTNIGIDIVAWDEAQDPYAVITSLLGGSKVSVSDRMWAQHLFGLNEAGSVSANSAANLMAQLRMSKSAEEVESLRAAAAAIDSVHAQLEQWLRVGRSEVSVAADISRAIIDAGHATVDFVIVGSGPNGASPHHDASDRVIEAGDPVVVDIGGTMPDGYCSDSTRTYVVGGEPPSEFAAMYDVLRHAQQAATSSVRAGVSAESIDRAAREVITEAGYGEQFIHRTGHGIGLESHEPPYIVEGNTLQLEAGMAFSVEPGIYLDGRYGARIEDIVVATENGVDNLGVAPRELRVIGG